jgi:hypothetical protein
MIVQIIGWYCLIHAVLGEIALLATVIQKDELPEGARARTKFINMGFFAVAVFCLK